VDHMGTIARGHGADDAIAAIHHSIGILDLSGQLRKFRRHESKTDSVSKTESVCSPPSSFSWFRVS